MSVSRSLCVVSSCSLGLLFLVGCGGGVSVPPVDPVAATAKALELYDKSGDKALDETELAACPPLLAEINEYDLNGDRMIDESELLDRIKVMYERKVGLTQADCTVTLDGEPLEGATVKYVPDAVLGEGTTQPASGVTNAKGYTKLSLDASVMPELAQGRQLMQVGLYRVEITHPSKQIPAKYNTETELGFELHPDRHAGPNGFFDLVTK